MKLYIIILSIISTYLLSCSKGYNCEGGCDSNYDYVKKVGEINFQDSTADILPDPMPSKITFKNDKGFSSEFKLNTDTIYKRLATKVTVVEKPCCSDKNADYVTYPCVKFIYEPVKSIFNITIDKEKYINSSIIQNDTILQADFTDFFRITIINNVGLFATGNPGFSNMSYTFMPLVSLNSTTFTDVYQIQGMYNYYDEPIFVKELYFKTGVGIVGFVFSNNEVWSRQ